MCSSDLSSRMASLSWVASRVGFLPQRALSMAAAFFMAAGSIPVKGSSNRRVNDTRYVDYLLHCERRCQVLCYYPCFVYGSHPSVGSSEHYGKIKVQRSWYKLLMYISIFPQLVAGPIVRYAVIENEIDNRVITSADVSDGIR